MSYVNLHRAPDVSAKWRTATLEVWGAAFGDWVRQNYNVTVRPGDSAHALCVSLANENGAKVRLMFAFGEGFAE